MILRSMIVDDEPLAVDRMQLLLSKINNVEVVATAANGREALDILYRGGIDLLFLDVEMPSLDAFDMIEQLMRDVADLPHVVLVTAHQIHASTAFDAGVLDFLTKPVRLSRLETAVSRVVRARRDSQDAARFADLSQQVEAMRRGLVRRPEDDLWVQRRGEVIRVNVSRINRLQAEGEYVRLFVDGSDYLHREALAAVYERLDPDRFIRIHRSSVVEREAIKSVRRKSTGSYQVVLEDGTVLPVGRTYRQAIRSVVAMGGA